MILHAKGVLRARILKLMKMWIQIAVKLLTDCGTLISVCSLWNLSFLIYKLRIIIAVQEQAIK